jgi:murein DD-endopeptidase MepM/ murein hydrolase activator NlpD
MRRLIAGLAMAGVFACSSPPPPVEYPQGPVGPEAPSLRAAQGAFQPDYFLYACTPSFSNRPDTDRSGRILGYDALIVVKGVVLAAAPVNGACMTSGFGPRFGSMHKGIDLQAKPAVPVYSAGPGRILEVSEQTGFGYQVLIGHGNGVYTRYGHLAYFAEGLAPGQKIGFGQPLGLMGQTGNATAIHLHYEVLTGNYNTPRKSWGLQANNPLDFPRWPGLDGVS